MEFLCFQKNLVVLISGSEIAIEQNQDSVGEKWTNMNEVYIQNLWSRYLTSPVALNFW